MKAHELATLNEAREENIELKRTAQGLRQKLDAVVRINDGMRAGAAALGKAFIEQHSQIELRWLHDRAKEILEIEHPAPSAN